MEIYWRTVNGDKNRYKLRLRYYSDNPKSPVFFEIKRRMKDVILKQRCGVTHAAVPLLLAGHLPDESHLLSKDPSNVVAIQRFHHLMMGLNAKPKSHIYYLREAYVADNDEVRITMDRNVFSEPNLNPTIKQMGVVMKAAQAKLAGKRVHGPHMVVALLFIIGQSILQ